MSQISFHHPDTKKSVSLSEYRALYEAWLEAYAKDRNPPMSSSLYYFSQPNQNKPTVYSFVPSAPWGQRLGARRSLWRSILDGICGFSLFPDTVVLPDSAEIKSDEEAILNDWVMVGSDLYQAIHGRIISASDVGSQSTELTSTAAR